MVHRLILAYRGTDYAGWQHQINATAIQDVVEDALGALLGGRVRLHGASRTDAGVHARGQAAHLELPRPFALRGLVHGANHHLPADIRVLAAHRMGEGFHARKSALGKEYTYQVHRGGVVAPLDEPWTWRVEAPLDVGAIRRALAFLPGRHDFSAFALAGGGHAQPWRRLFAASVDEDGRELRFRFAGDGFLRGMVRTLVGTLIEIGAGRRPADSMAELLEGRPRSAAGPTAAARGLVLERVLYSPRWRPIERYDP